MRQCLEECDVRALLRLWAHVSPHLPAPASEGEALAALHMARTAAETILFSHRAYSHKWLLDRGLPSQLPEHLKPEAERRVERVAPAVGISVNVRNEFLRPAAGEVQKAMESAVMDAEADGRLLDDQFVSARMREARLDAWRKIVGTADVSRVGMGRV